MSQTQHPHPRSERGSTSERNEQITTRWFVILPLTFSAFVGGLIIWVAHLMRVSVEMHDVPSASIGISLVAIPVFLLMLGVFNYLYWGLLRNR